MDRPRVAFGVFGLGGYAGGMCRLLEKIAAAPDAPVALAGVCEPDLSAHAARVAELRGAGVAVVDQAEDLLSLPIDAVWLPLPIHLHRSYAERCLQAGKAVLCEKPAAGALQDVDAMIAARDRARLPVAIGFQDVYHPAQQELKRRLRDGVIGAPRQATIIGCWPRDDAYYARGWAAALRRGETWVLDSPANNALAHPLHLAMFLLGPDERRSAAPVRVEAELYRARPGIENCDTTALRVALDNGVSLTALYTHACRRLIDPGLSIHGDGGVVRVQHNQAIEIAPLGRPPQRLSIQTPGHEAMIRAFAAATKGDAAPVLGTLEMARMHTLAINAAQACAPVREIAPEFTARHEGRIVAVEGIEALFETCVLEGKLPHEAGRAAWTRPAGVCDAARLTRFDKPA